MLREPTYVAMRNGMEEIVAIGQDAKELSGKLMGGIILFRPVKEGEVSDGEVAELLVKYLSRKANRRMRGLKSINCLAASMPCEANELSKRTLSLIHI